MDSPDEPGRHPTRGREIRPLKFCAANGFAQIAPQIPHKNPPAGNPQSAPKWFSTPEQAHRARKVWPLDQYRSRVARPTLVLDAKRSEIGQPRFSFVDCDHSD
jgi:hypothetical protein